MPVNETIYEDGNGGQLLLQNNDIAQTESLSTLAYLLMFGGNVEGLTKKENNVGELSLDWWGNNKNTNSSTWINSETEKTLRGIALSSGSRSIITDSVKKDITSLEEYGEVEVEVTLPRLNRVQITITIKEPGAKKSKRLILIWDATKSEIIEQRII